MSKEVTKENLRKFAEDELHGIANMVSLGHMEPSDAKGRARELFYLSANFDLGLVEESRRLIREMKDRHGV